MYSVALGWNILNIFVMSIWSSVSFKTLCLDDLSISVRGVLKSPTIIVLLLMCFFDFVINWFIEIAAPMLGA